MEALEPGKSKHLAKCLRSLDQQYPAVWKGKLVRYNSLVDTLDTSTLVNASLDREQEFFGKFFREIDRVNAQFCRAARAVISAYRRRHAWWFSWLRNKKLKLCEDAERVEGSPEALVLHAQICLEYARLNADVLNKLAAAHDRMFGNTSGRIILDSMWKTHSGLANFLHSPLLSELEALAMSFQPQDTQGDGSDCCKNGQSAAHTACGDCKSASGQEDEGLECPICLDVLYRPIGLACGHKFCTPCISRAVAPGSVWKPGHENSALATVSHRAKCPQCRQQCVFRNASYLTVLSNNLKQRFPKYWKDRQIEDKESGSRSKEIIIQLLEAQGMTYPNFLFL